jgi:isoleucyl-tRNA synthetase
MEITVALDLSLTEELKMEGIARDVVNRIQNQRKDQGLDVLDRIRIEFSEIPAESVRRAIREHEAYICQETQAGLIQEVAGEIPETVVELDEGPLPFRIQKI